MVLIVDGSTILNALRQPESKFDVQVTATPAASALTGKKQMTEHHSIKKLYLNIIYSVYVKIERNYVLNQTDFRLN